MELAVTVLVDGLRGKEPFSHGRENTRRVPAMIPRLNNNDNHNNGKKTVSLYRVHAIFNKTPTTYFVAIDRPEMVYKLLVGGEGGIGEQKKLSIFIFFIIFFFFLGQGLCPVYYIYHSPSVESHQIHTPRVTCLVICALWVRMTCSSTFIRGTACAAWSGGSQWEGCACAAAADCGPYRKSLYLPLHFAVNPTRLREESEIYSFLETIQAFT